MPIHPSFSNPAPVRKQGLTLTCSGCLKEVAWHPETTTRDMFLMPGWTALIDDHGRIIRAFCLDHSWTAEHTTLYTVDDVRGVI